jgi:stage II sporulation protein D
MPALWHMEAVKAQAVAARTFTLYRAGRVGQHYDLCDTTFSQVYAGAAREHPNSTQAVNETAGLVMLHEGQPIFAAYSACAGGHTANSEDVWVTALPFLRAVPELYHGNNLPWQRTVTLTEISHLTSSTNIGQVQSIEIITSDYGLVMQLRIHGAAGIHTVNRESIRSFFGPLEGGSLRSRMFTIAGGTVTPLGTNQSASQNQNTQPQPPEIFILEAGGNITPANYLQGLHIISSTTLSTLQQSEILTVINSSGITETISINETQSPPPNTTGQAVSMRSNSYTITLEGRGWGHGVGMSQHGAHAMAQQGYTFREILLWYYTGVEITQQ